jgi:hypothetical protein
LVRRVVPEGTFTEAKSNTTLEPVDAIDALLEPIAEATDRFPPIVKLPVKVVTVPSIKEIGLDIVRDVRPFKVPPFPVMVAEEEPRFTRELIDKIPLVPKTTPPVKALFPVKVTGPTIFSAPSDVKSSIVPANVVLALDAMVRVPAICKTPVPAPNCSIATPFPVLICKVVPVLIFKEVQVSVLPRLLVSTGDPEELVERAPRVVAKFVLEIEETVVVPDSSVQVLPVIARLDTPATNVPPVLVMAPVPSAVLGVLETVELPTVMVPPDCS